MAAAVAENRCTYRIISSASYRYEQPAHQVVTVLRLLPPETRGFQHLRRREIQVAPLPYALPEHVDEWGNCVVEARVESVRENLTLIVDLTVDTACRYDADGRALPTPLPSADPSADRERYLAFTPRTTPSPALEQFAADLRRAVDPREDPAAFITEARKRVHERLAFKSGATHVGTTAAEAWEGGHGVCQDLTHVALVACRLSGIPARYVSGFVPGEGVMHAWVEALIAPPGQGPVWIALDPTYDKWVDERYVAVAVGRDYGDITPTSGYYYGGKSVLRYGTRMIPVRKDLVLL